MGFKRFLKKTLIPGYNTFDMVQKIAENGVIDGIKEKMKEDYLEDTPVISHIYNVGKYDGKKEGYVKASNEYENKLLRQGNEFLKQTKDLRNERDEYEKLLDEYDKYIDELMQKDDLSDQDKDHMNQMMIVERKLIGLTAKEASYSNDDTSNSLECDERGFIKNTARHKNGTKYDDEGYDKYGHDKGGYDRYGFKLNGYHRNGTRYDDKGFDRQHYNRNERVECSVSVIDNTTSSSSIYDERGFIKNTARHKNGTKYDDEGYDKFGYDKNGYDRNGLDKFGKPKKIISTLPKYDERGFIKNTAKHKNGTKYDDEGYDKFGYNKNGYDKNGLDKFGHPKRV